MKNWTDEQRDAIYSKWCDDEKSISSNILVNAAAGSGKTAVLVERIINKLCSDKNSPDFCDIKNILVVTFTNAAAKEMKQRITDALNEKFLQAIDDNDVVFAEHLKNQIKSINLADITTIDAFCLKIVKNYFHLLNIDPDFKIADSAECEMIKDEIIEELFEEEYSKESFVELALRLADSRDISNLGNIIRKLYDYTRSLPAPDEWLLEKKELILSSEEDNIFYKTIKEEISNKINVAKNYLFVALRNMIKEAIPFNLKLTEDEIVDIISKNPPEEENDIYYCFGTYYLAIYNDFMLCKSLLKINDWDKMYQLFSAYEFIRLNQSPKFKNKELLIKDK
ncbi:MAG: UvrD-helicase domain-containing protein, partial [Clostridia bacterium]|nr:UvrD-helicase domain-containing protein [Clostridia bacterium]